MPWHAGRQHAQGAAQIDYAVQAGAKEIFGGGQTNMRKLPEISVNKPMSWKIFPKKQ
jgi:hypothetical protein